MQMRKLIGLFLALALMMGVMPAAPALAGYRWCSTDPVIHLPDGTLVHVTVGVPFEQKHTATVTLTISAPAGSVLTGNAQGPFDVMVSFSATRTDNRVVVEAIPQSSFPVQVNIMSQGTTLASAESAPGETASAAATIGQ